MKKLRVTVDGKSYDVVVEVLDGSSAPGATEVGKAVTSATPVSPPRAVPEAAPKAESSETARASGGVNAVTSPLSGKIVSIDVVVGQGVNEGMQVATIEAMKMNTFVYASKQGRVSAVHVKAGDAVEEGAPLIDLA